MRSIGVENLRSFKGSGNIKLNPITLLVGLNSSGKSSFLRLLPLLRQSYEKKTSGPILWYGDYVDFGTFSESLNKHSNDKEIVFEFEADILNGINNKEKIDLKINIALNEDSEGNTHISYFEFKSGSTSLRINSKYGKCYEVLLNGETQKNENITDGYIYGSSFVPMKNKKGLPFMYLDRDMPTHIFNMFMSHRRDKEVIKKIYEILKPNFSARTKKQNIFEGIGKIGFGEPDDILKALKSEFNTKSLILGKGLNSIEDAV